MVLDLKNAVSADINQPAGNLEVCPQGGGQALDDGTALADQATYEVNLVDADEEEEDDYPPAPPPSPDDSDDSDDEDEDGHDGDQLPNGHVNPHQDGVIAWVYFAGAANGPVEYDLAADSTAAELKESIAADQSSPVACAGAGDLAVYDGSRWLSDNDPIIGGNAYTVQQILP